MSAFATWQQFLHRSLATRLEPATFESYVALLSAKHPLPPHGIADLFLRPTAENNASPDPRIPRYIQILLAPGVELVTVPSVLKALGRWSTFGAAAAEKQKAVASVDAGKDGEDGRQAAEGTPAEGQEQGQRQGQEQAPEHAGERERIRMERERRWQNSYAVEEMLFYRLAKMVSSGAAPGNLQEAVELILVCVQWTRLAVSASSSAHDQMLVLGAHAEELGAATMALGTLLVAVVENGEVLRALAKGSPPKGTGKELGRQLEAFVALLMQGSPQCASRLEVFRSQTLVAIEPLDKGEEMANKEIDEFLDGGQLELAVADLPVMTSRAHLYVYLNSLLVGRPLIDDHAIFGYLHNRYQGDVQSTTVDLILSSFDVLANAMFRNERTQSQFIMRSFIHNKLPLLLVTLSASMFPPLTPEYCITEALGHVDTNAFPTLSNLFEGSSNNMFSDSVRQDFCFACCLHGLIQESSIVTLLGDIPMQSLPAGGRYVKDELVQQCLSDPERAEGLIGELELMDGNVGAASQAITEFIGRLCRNKETMSLKSLCGQLAKKSTSLDVMLLFDKPVTLLQPICDLLDSWRYEDDQGEYQPVYEEFGSIVLLVLAFTHRFGLSTVDLGTRSADSFVAKLVNQGHLSRAMDSLTELEQSHLDGWIKGLFDNESGGLGDELMSACPPQDFYLLIPTLFHHIVLACSTNNLSDESLKGGLEYLVDTFLLPSLVPGITWLSSHLWESRGDANAVLQILSALITQPTLMSSNTEASEMLTATLNIVAKRLEHSLRWLQRAEPQRQDIEPLSKALRGSLSWERRGAAEHTELESWTSTAGGGLVVAIRQTIVALVQWGLNPGMNMNPANYTHRQMLAGLRILGAQRLLGAIIDEVKAQTETGNGSVVIDVATALICAPDAASWSPGNELSMLDASQAIPPLQRRMNLREALKIEAETAPAVHKTDAFHAETVIRLYRRVVAQLAMVQPPMMAHDGMGDLAAGLDANVHDALDAAALDGAMAGAAGLGEGQDLGSMGISAADQDLMSELMSGGNAGDLLDTFGGGQELPDGMGY